MFEGIIKAPYGHITDGVRGFFEPLRKAAATLDPQGFNAGAWAVLSNAFLARSASEMLSALQELHADHAAVFGGAIEYRGHFHGSVENLFLKEYPGIRSPWIAENVGENGPVDDRSLKVLSEKAALELLDSYLATHTVMQCLEEVGLNSMALANLWNDYRNAEDALARDGAGTPVRKTRKSQAVSETSRGFKTLSGSVFKTAQTYGGVRDSAIAEALGVSGATLKAWCKKGNDDAIPPDRLAAFADLLQRGIDALSEAVCFAHAAANVGTENTSNDCSGECDSSASIRG